MARIRSIKPEFFTSEDVSALPLRARLTWIGLWTHCDDHGRTKDTAKLIKAAVWVLDDVSLRDVEEDLSVLADHGRIVRYAVDGVRYLAVQNWHFHQSINRPGRPKYPAPPVPIMAPEPGENGHCPNCWAALRAHGTLSEPSLPGENPSMGVSPGQPSHDVFTDDSVSVHGGLTPGKEQGKEQGKEGNRARGRKRPATKLPDTWAPTDSHHAYAAQHGLDLQREVFRFRNHAEANDRRQASWNAAFTTWLDKARDYAPPKPPNDDWRRWSEQ